MKKIFIASDHAGYNLKNSVISKLKKIIDLGPKSSDSVDYPDFAKKLSKKVAANKGSFGILICGTGVGMSMVANKQRGIRAVLAHNEYVGVMGRKHNDANVLCMGARVIGPSLGLEIVKWFLSTEFEGGRHERRVEMFE